MGYLDGGLPDFASTDRDPVHKQPDKLLVLEEGFESSSTSSMRFANLASQALVVSASSAAAALSARSASLASRSSLRSAR